MKPSRFLLAACALAPAFATIPAFAADAPAAATPAAATPAAATPAAAISVAETAPTKASVDALAEAAAKAPATAPASPTLAPMVVQQLDADAIALMGESIKAYGALRVLSQTFEVANSKEGEADPKKAISGSLTVQKPGNARMEFKANERDYIFVTDGAILIRQTKPKEYQQYDLKRPALESVINSLPSSADTPLTLLMSGLNPITDKSAPRWQTAKLIVKDGMPGVGLLGPQLGTSEPLNYEIYLDPQTKLLARVEVSAMRLIKVGDPKVLIAEVTNFAPNAAPLTPAIFRYVPGPGVERFYSYDKNLVVGADPFALTGKTLDNKTISFDNYKGRVVLLDFWATWCGPCRAELPNVLTNYRNYHPWGFDIVGVSLDDDENEATLREFTLMNRMDWPQIYDGKAWETQDAQTYGVKGIPFTLLIGKDGKIAAVNPRDEDLEPAIRAALMKS